MYKLLTVICCFILTPAVFAGPVSVHGDLKLLDKGGKHGLTLCDQHGKPIQLRGFSQLDLAQADTAWVPGKTIPNIIALSGSNAVRLAMYTSTYGKGYMDQNTAGKTVYRSKIKALIADAIAADIYVLVDWHILNDKDPWSEEYHREARIFFEDIAKTYGHKDNLLFELANEPLQVSFKNTIKPFAEHVLAGIRKYSDNITTVGTPNWSQHVDDVIGNQISDNLGRGVMYNIHFYAGTHGHNLRKRAESSAAIINKDLTGPWRPSDFSQSGQWVLKRISK